jgi:hypothetical protein
MFDFEAAEDEEPLAPPARPEPPTPPPAPEPEIEAEAELAEPEELEPEELEPEELEGAEELEASEELEPPASVPDPPPPPPERGSEPPGRARGRVHHPTEEWTPPDPVTGESHPVGQEEEHEPQGPPSGAPLRPEGAPPEPAPAPEADSGPELYDFATDEGALEIGAEAPADSPAPEPADEFEELGPVTDEAEVVDAPPAGDQDFEDDYPPEDEEPAREAPASAPAAQDADDLLAESPEFIEEEGEEGEDLWFEKGPPKDFDFEDED